MRGTARILEQNTSEKSLYPAFPRATGMEGEGEAADCVLTNRGCLGFQTGDHSPISRIAEQLAQRCTDRWQLDGTLLCGDKSATFAFL